MTLLLNQWRDLKEKNLYIVYLAKVFSLLTKIVLLKISRKSALGFQDEHILFICTIVKLLI